MLSRARIGSNSNAANTTRQTWNVASVASPNSTISCAASDVSATQSNRLVRNNAPTAGTVKSLFDSCYVKPEQNSKVMQDNHPLKQKALKEALSRYETQVESQKQANNEIVKKHFERIELDQKVWRQQQDTKKAKADLFKRQLKEQIEHNVSLTTNSKHPC